MEFLLRICCLLSPSLLFPSLSLLSSLTLFFSLYFSLLFPLYFSLSSISCLSPLYFSLLFPLYFSLSSLSSFLPTSLLSTFLSHVARAHASAEGVSGERARERGIEQL
jgi:hypothetical protein